MATIFGTTYSQREIEYLGLDHQKAFATLLDLRLPLIRIGTYWSELEISPGVYDFSRITSMLDLCQKKKQKVIVTIGIKAPRWPEFYLPSWLTPENQEKPLFIYLQKLIKKLNKYSCITYWQVENEALDPSGPEKLTVPLSLLEKEVALVRSLDSRPVILTAWGNELTQNDHCQKLAQLGDIVGIDLYPKKPERFLFWFIWAGVKDSPEMLRNLPTQTDTPFWVTELQAEPWERNQKDTWLANPPSCSPDQLRRNIDYAVSLELPVILLWGYEHWYKRLCDGDDRYFRAVKEAILCYA